MIAKDSAPEPYTLTGTALVEISLTDENDETPEINVLLVRPSGSSSSPIDDNRQQQLFDRNQLNGLDNTNGAKFTGQYVTSIEENPAVDTVIAYIQVWDCSVYFSTDQKIFPCFLSPTRVN